MMMTNRINPGIYILPDHAVKEAWRTGGFLAANYAVQDKKGVEETDIKINAVRRRERVTAIPGQILCLPAWGFPRSLHL